MVLLVSHQRRPLEEWVLLCELRRITQVGYARRIIGIEVLIASKRPRTDIVCPSKLLIHRQILKPAAELQGVGAARAEVEREIVPELPNHLVEDVGASASHTQARKIVREIDR